jgi:hypothetical protein
MYRCARRLLLILVSASAAGSLAQAAALPAIPTINNPPIGPSATVYYVDSVNGHDAASGLLPSAAFATIRKATTNPAFKGGDVVQIAPGQYVESVVIAVSGTPAGYTTLRGTPGQAPPQIISSPSVASPTNPAAGGSTISIRADYVRVSGLDVTFQYDTTLPATSGTGISVCCHVNGVPLLHHHLFIDQNTVHDTSGGGITVMYSDYVTILGNYVTSTSNYALNQTSGIGMGVSTDYDLQPGYHNMIVRNISVNNVTLVMPNYLINGQPTTGDCTTDGNGIIIDSNNGWPAGTPPYRSATLISGNITASNGGKGVTIFESDNIMAANNLAFNNLDSTLECDAATSGQMDAELSTNIHYVSNLMYNAAAGYGGLDEGSNNDVWQNNHTNGAPIPIFYDTNIVQDSGAVPLGQGWEAAIPPTATQVYVAGNQLPANGQTIPANSKPALAGAYCVYVSRFNVCFQ